MPRDEADRESTTRKRRIAPMLDSLGWRKGDREDVEVSAVLEWPADGTAADRAFKAKLAHLLRKLDEVAAA